MKYILSFVKGIIFTILGLLAVIGYNSVLNPDYAGFVKDISKRGDRYITTGK
jgi:hypothetical protein